MSSQSVTCSPSLALIKAGTRWLPNLRPMPVRFRAVPQRQKVVDLASRQTNQKQIYHFLYSARHFLGCAGVRFSRSQDPEAYSSSAKRTFASEVRLSLSSQRRCVCTRALGLVDANLGRTTVGLGTRTGAVCEEGQEAVLSAEHPGCNRLTQSIR